MKKITKIELTKDDILDLIAEKYNCYKSKIKFTYIDKCVRCVSLDGVQLT